MTGHLRPVEKPLLWGRLESRAQIAAYVADRREVLTRLCNAEGLGEFRTPVQYQTQLAFEEAA
jgi:hypothetical protein